MTSNPRLNETVLTQINGEEIKKNTKKSECYTSRIWKWRIPLQGKHTWKQYPSNKWGLNQRKTYNANGGLVL